MRMVITTGDLEEGAHHVSEEVYKKVALLIMSETHPEWSRPTKRAADGVCTCGTPEEHWLGLYCHRCGGKLPPRR